MDHGSGHWRSVGKEWQTHHIHCVGFYNYYSKRKNFIQLVTRESILLSRYSTIVGGDVDRRPLELPSSSWASTSFLDKFVVFLFFFFSHFFFFFFFFRFFCPELQKESIIFGPTCMSSTVLQHVSSVDILKFGSPRTIASFMINGVAPFHHVCTHG